MKITCDNCGAVYRIPEEKLTKDVSRATCKKCGAKLIIRRPSAATATDDLRLTGAESGFGDDDSVINHEERTVIAQVPELQKFDATPPIGSGGSVSSQDELRGLLGGAHDIPSVSAPVAPPAPSPAPPASVPPENVHMRATQPVKPVEAPAPSPAQATIQAPLAAAPDSPPTITSTTSPARPSGEAGRAAVQPASPTVAARRSDRRKANVMDIFSQQPPQTGPAPELKAPTSKLPLVLLGVALLSILSFVPEGLWGLTRLTAIGFFVALYCILAALLTQIDLASSGKINLAKVFVIPAVVCGGLLALLMLVQEDKIAFLHPELDIELVKQYIATLPEAPEAERASKAPLSTRIKTAMRSGRVGDKSAFRRKASADPSESIKFTRPDGRETTAGEFHGEDGPGVLATAEIGNIQSGWVPTRERRKVPGGDRVASNSKSADFDKEAIETAIYRGRVQLCFTTSAAGMELPGRIELRILMTPKGSVRDAQITTPGLQGGSLERCMRTKVMGIEFPSHDGSGAEWYSHTFIL